MKLSVISAGCKIENEAKIVNWMFDNGLYQYHLRKNNPRKSDYIAFLDQIDKVFLDRIVIHDYFELVESYSIKGIHLNTQKRKEAYTIEHAKSYAYNLSMKLSTSCHSKEEYELLRNEFDQLWVGPVFESISKKGYAPSIHWKVKDKNTRMVAVGGVCPANLTQLCQRGFDKAAVLGYLWNDMKHLKNNFIALKPFL